MEPNYLYSLILIVPILLYFLFRGNSKSSQKVKYGDYQGIINEYSLKLQLDPNDASAYYQRGLAYLKSNNKEKALADLKMAGIRGYNKAFEVIDNNNLNGSSDTLQLGSKYNQYSDIDIQKSAEYQGAIRDYDKLLKQSPKNSVTYFMRAEVKIVYKDYIGAIEDLTYAIKYNTKFAEALYKRGMVKHQLKNDVEAIKDLEIALSLGYKKANKLLTELKTGKPKAQVTA